MTPKFSNAALFADYESLSANLAKCEDSFFKPFNYSDLIAYVNAHFGNVAFARAYADWRSQDLRKRAQDLQRGGVSMATVFGNKNDSASIIAGNIIVDVMNCLQLYPEISSYIFLAQSSALIPLMHRLHAAGKRIIVINLENAINSAMARFADEFVCLNEKGYNQKSTENIDRNNVILAIKALLGNDGLTLNDLNEKLANELPDFSLADYGCESLQDFIQTTASHAMRIVDGENGQIVLAGSGRNASAFSDDELASFSLEEYMKATRWYIVDGDIRDRVLHNIYTLFEDNGRVLSNEELRNMVDPDRIVEDKPWHGTIFSLVYGACLWENPDTSSQHLQNRKLSLFRTVKSEDDFLIRYYVSLFKKAYTDRPGITPRDCAALMHPNAVDEHLPIYEQVFEELANSSKRK